MIHRRSLLTGLIGIIAAPAIVRYGSLMPVRSIDRATAFRFEANTIVFGPVPIGVPERFRTIISISRDGVLWKPISLENFDVEIGGIIEWT